MPTHKFGDWCLRLYKKIYSEAKIHIENDLISAGSWSRQQPLFSIRQRCTLNYDFFRCILGGPKGWLEEVWQAPQDRCLQCRQLWACWWRPLIPPKIAFLSLEFSSILQTEHCRTFAFHIQEPEKGILQEAPQVPKCAKQPNSQTVSQSFSLVSLALYFFIAYLDIYNPWRYTYQIYRIYYLYLHKIHEDPMRCFSRCWLEHCSAQSSPARLADASESTWKHEIKKLNGTMWAKIHFYTFIFGSGRCCSVGGFPGCLVSFQRLGKNKRLQETKKKHLQNMQSMNSIRFNQPNVSSMCSSEFIPGSFPDGDCCSQSFYTALAGWGKAMRTIFEIQPMDNFDSYCTIYVIQT